MKDTRATNQEEQARRIVLGIAGVAGAVIGAGLAMVVTNALMDKRTREGIVDGFAQTNTKETSDADKAKPTPKPRKKKPTKKNI